MEGKLDLTAAACIVFNNKILLLHHRKLDKWLFPGGHIEPNETPDEAVVREVKEETGLDFEFADYGSIQHQPEVVRKCAVPFYADVHSVGGHNHYGMIYLGTVSSPDFKISHESKAIRWFSLEEINSFKELLPGIRKIAVWALSRQKV